MEYLQQNEELVHADVREIVLLKIDKINGSGKVGPKNATIP